MRRGFEPPIKMQHPFVAHPPLFTNHGKVMSWKPGMRQVIAPTNGKSVNHVIKASVPDKAKPEAEKAPAQTVDLTKDIFTVGELLSLDYDEYPHLLKKLIPQGNITFLAGSSDVGKSLFYTNLALKIITDQKEYIGQRINPTYGKVLLISTEDGPIAISSRLKKQLNGKKLLKKQEDRMIILTSSDKLVARVKKILNHYSVDLIVLDAFGDVFDGDINTINSVRLFLNEFAEIIKKHNTSMLIVHHIAKGKENQAANKGQLLGSAGIEGKAREVLILTKDTSKPSKRTLKVVKANYASEEDKRVSYELLFDSKTLTYKSMGTAIKELDAEVEKKKPGRKVNEDQVKEVFKLKAEGLTGAKIAELTDIHPGTVSRWLKKYKGEFET